MPAAPPAVSAWGRSSKLVFEPNPNAAIPDPSTTGPPGLSSTVSPTLICPAHGSILPLASMLVTSPYRPVCSPLARIAVLRRDTPRGLKR